jgi:hypothetical protein
MAMEQKRANSASPLRPHPSARFAAMDEHDRRLTRQPIQFLARKGGRDLINRQRQLVRFLPDLQFVKIFHVGVPLDSIGPLSDESCCEHAPGRGPMETFTKLFGSLLAFVYHCFDRIVIQGYLPLLTRPEHIVHFFRDVHGIYPITKQALAKRTNEYQRWWKLSRATIAFPCSGLTKR